MPDNPAQTANIAIMTQPHTYSRNNENGRGL